LRDKIKALKLKVPSESQISYSGHPVTKPSLANCNPLPSFAILHLFLISLNYYQISLVVLQVFIACTLRNVGPHSGPV